MLYRVIANQVRLRRVTTNGLVSTLLHLTARVPGDVLIQDVMAAVTQGTVATENTPAPTTPTNPTPAPAPTGPPVEMRATTDWIQWRPAGGTWTDLLPLSTITGPPGTPADMTRVKALEDAAKASPRVSTGTATLPTLLAGITQQVTVTLNPAMPDTAYNATASVIGGVSLLGSISAIITAKTQTSVTVAVRAALAVGAGSVVDVVAVRYA